jgi:hypothetical protein
LGRIAYAQRWAVGAKGRLPLLNIIYGGIYTQGFKEPIAALKTLGDMGVTGAAKKSLARAEIERLKAALLRTGGEGASVNFSWELFAGVFQICPAT